MGTCSGVRLFFGTFVTEFKFSSCKHVSKFVVNTYCTSVLLYILLILTHITILLPALPTFLFQGKL